MKDETTGLRTLSEWIGQNLVSCEKLSVINFQWTDCEIKEEDRQLLRTKDADQALDADQAFESRNFPKTYQSEFLAHFHGWLVYESLDFTWVWETHCMLQKL